jgi:hypothetical protein
MGLLSLDTMKLKIKRAVGSIEERNAADVVLRILDNHHLLLCSLLILQQRGQRGAANISDFFFKLQIKFEHDLLFFTNNI